MDLKYNTVLFFVKVLKSHGKSGHVKRK